MPNVKRTSTTSGDQDLRYNKPLFLSYVVHLNANICVPRVYKYHTAEPSVSIFLLRVTSFLVSIISLKFLNVDFYGLRDVNLCYDVL